MNAVTAWLHTGRDEIKDNIPASSSPDNSGWRYLWLGDRYPRGHRIPGPFQTWFAVYVCTGPSPEELGKPWWAWWDWTGSLVRRHGAVGWAWLGLCVAFAIGDGSEDDDTEDAP